MRIMALDFGDVRTGVAVSDPLGITAQGLETIKYDGNEKQLIQRIMELIKQYDVDKIVIGYPLNMNATKGPRAEKTDLFIEKLKKFFNKEIIKIDERLTTTQSQKTMTMLNVSKDKKRNIVDTLAAVYILETYLGRI